ncbi:MAG: NAD(+) synthase, partial [Clostridia bacterium]|nr:NAD(+) synthase [Clostridia bacterium]
MKNYGIYKVAAATPALRVLDVAYNEAQIADLIAKAEEAKTDVLVFPELCLTGYTAGDMLLQDTLLVAVERALLRLASCVGEMLVFVGAPLKKGGKVFNSAVAMANGRILGAVPKSYLPDYSSFCESRWFARGEASGEITLAGEAFPFGTDLLFEAENFPELKAAAEIGADLWATVSPSCFHAMAGATLICCPSADSESVNGAYLRKKLVLAQASRAICGYVYANAGEDESTTDAVYSGHNVIAEKGTLIAESEKFTKGIAFGEVDIQKILYERRRRDTFAQSEEGYRTVCFTLRTESARLTRGISKLPFVPSRNLHEQAESILSLQAHGLKKRLAHVRAKTAVIGVSGGLDSTLALLIVARAFDLLGKDRRDIVGVTMPGFGTSSRTKSQAERLMEALGCTVRKIPIADAVMQHFKDISHDPAVTDITYENAQARERTQILMDIANKNGGMVIGTGDMSELAL